jgi:hypothetical protein
MGAGAEDIREQLVTMMNRVGVFDSDVLREAAQSLRFGPQPIDVPPRELERREAIHSELDLKMPVEELADAMRACEELERLANELDEALGAERRG